MSNSRWRWCSTSRCFSGWYSTAPSSCTTRPGSCAAGSSQTCVGGAGRLSGTEEAVSRVGSLVRPAPHTKPAVSVTMQLQSGGRQAGVPACVTGGCGVCVATPGHRVAFIAELQGCRVCCGRSATTHSCWWRPHLVARCASAAATAPPPLSKAGALLAPIARPPALQQLSDPVLSGAAPCSAASRPPRRAWSRWPPACATGQPGSRHSRDRAARQPPPGRRAVAREWSCPPGVPWSAAGRALTALR